MNTILHYVYFLYLHNHVQFIFVLWTAFSTFTVVSRHLMFRRTHQGFMWTMASSISWRISSAEWEEIWTLKVSISLTSSQMHTNTFLWFLKAYDFFKIKISRHLKLQKLKNHEQISTKVKNVLTPYFTICFFKLEDFKSASQQLHPTSQRQPPNIACTSNMKKLLLPITDWY